MDRSTNCNSNQELPNVVGGSQSPEEHGEYEEYVEAEGELMYLSDGDDVIALLDGTPEPIVEEETNLEPAIIVENDHSVLYDADNPRIELNALFPNFEAFRNSLRHFAIKNNFEYIIKKSNKKRFMAVCSYKGCPWRIRAYRLRDDNTTFKITVLPNQHICPSVGRAKGTMTSKSWVTEKITDFLRRNPSVGAKEVQSKLVDDFHVTLSYSKAWRGRTAALEGVQGSWEKSFNLIYNFKAEVESKCPGSIVEIECERDGSMMRFDKMFVALKPCVDGFLHGCRPYLAVDSTHLTGRYTGQLATACGVDGFNWLYPVAYGVFDSETTETWTWFMAQLKKAIGDVPGLVISLDGCKGLDNGAANIFPEAERRVCFNHLDKNFKMRFHGPIYDNNFKPAAYAYTIEQCEIHLKAIKKASIMAFKYLEKHQLRSKFSNASKVDYVTNNISESFNNWIKDLKDLHVIELLNQIRRRIMMSFDKRRIVGRKITGKIVPSVVKELHEMSRHPDVRRMTVSRSADTCAEVSGTTKDTSWTRAVELDKQQCTCRQWQLCGKPCSHAVAFISTLRGTYLEDYVHEYYSIDRFRLAYDGVIMPISDKSRWLNSDPGFIVHPPNMKKAERKTSKREDSRCLRIG